MQIPQNRDVLFIPRSVIANFLHTQNSRYVSSRNRAGQFFGTAPFPEVWNHRTCKPNQAADDDADQIARVHNAYTPDTRVRHTLRAREALADF